MVARFPALGTLAAFAIAICAVSVATAGPAPAGALVRQAPAAANATAPPATAATTAAAAAAAAPAAPAAPAGPTRAAPVAPPTVASAPAAASNASATTNTTTAPTTNTTKNGTANASPDPIPNAGTVPGSSIPAGGNEPKSSSCFPEHALVELESGQRRRMDELAVGDRVLVAHQRYAAVFLFTHRRAAVRSPFVSIRTASGHKISASPGHYLYANGALVPASAVRLGDHMPLGTGVTSVVVFVSTSVEAGLYNPQTLHGDIVVDGVVASTYTTAVSPRLGHAWLAPVRALYATFGLTSGLLDNGADTMVTMIPGGSDAY